MGSVRENYVGAGRNDGFISEPHQRVLIRVLLTDMLLNVFDYRVKSFFRAAAVKDVQVLL